MLLCHISKILKNESNSQPFASFGFNAPSCVISQRYSKMKAIHNISNNNTFFFLVVSYLKDTQNESNSQRICRTKTPPAVVSYLKDTQK